MTTLRRRAVGALALVAVALAGCGSSGDADRVTVDEFTDRPPTGPVEVEGFLLIEGDDAHLCATIAESYPPQCGGASIGLDAFDAAVVADVVTSEGDTSWLEGAVVVLDPSDDGRATVLSVVGP